MTKRTSSSEEQVAPLIVDGIDLAPYAGRRGALKREQGEAGLRALYQYFDGNIIAAARFLGYANPSTLYIDFHQLGLPGLGRYGDTATPVQKELQYWKEAWARLEERLQRYVSSLRPIRPPKLKPSKRDPHAFCLCISDCQAGALVDPARTMGRAEYSWEIFQRRAERLRERLAAVVRNERPANPMHVGIINLMGDSCEGEDVFPLQYAELDRLVNEQVFGVAHELAEVVRVACSLFPNGVYVYGVYGNHSLGRRTSISLDRVVYQIMGLLLRDQPGLTFRIAMGPYLGYEVRREMGIDYPGRWKWRCLITHGHQARRYMGLPYYALDRMVARLDGMTGIVWDAMYCGHHHEFAQRGRWIVNGSWVGGSAFSVERMQAIDRPSQYCHLWHPRQGRSWGLNIWLDEVPRLQTATDHTIGPVVDPTS